MRVFIPCETRHDIEELEEEGTVLSCVSARLSPFAGDEMLEAFGRALDEEGFDPKTDRVALVGPQLVVALFLAAVMVRFGTVTAYMFNSRMDHYETRVLSSASVGAA